MDLYFFYNGLNNLYTIINKSGKHDYHDELIISDPLVFLQFERDIKIINPLYYY